MRLCVSGARFGVRLTLRIRDWGALARAVTYTLPQEHRFTHVQGSRYADLHHKNWTLQHCRHIMPLPMSSVLVIGPIMVFTFFFVTYTTYTMLPVLQPPGLSLSPPIASQFSCSALPQVCRSQHSLQP